MVWFRMIGTSVGAVMSVVLVGLFPARSHPVSRGSGVVGSRLHFYRHAPAQLRVLCSGAVRLYGRDHRWRFAWRHWRGECRHRLPACRHPGQRDLPRDRLRRRRSRRDPSRRCAAGASAAALAGRAIHWDDDAVHATPATDQPDDVRHCGVLQCRVGDHPQRRFRGIVVSPVTAIVASIPHAPAPGTDLAICAVWRRGARNAIGRAMSMPGCRSCRTTRRRCSGRNF